MRQHSVLGNQYEKNPAMEVQEVLVARREHAEKMGDLSDQHREKTAWWGNANNELGAGMATH